MKRQAKPHLLIPALSSDSEDMDLKKIVPDSSSDEEGDQGGSFGEGGESEMIEEGGESEISDGEESDMSEEALMDFNQKHVENADKKLFVRSVENNVPSLQTTRKEKKGEITVTFEYSQPSEAYYHTIKALLSQYLDGEEQENLDTISLADHICERASIGQVVVSPLDPSKDPDLIPELQTLSDQEFAKAAVKLNSERDVFGFSSILSLNFKTLRKQKPEPFLLQIFNYVLSKADQHCKQSSEFKQILTTKNVGLLVTERLINLPSEIVPALLSELPQDLEWTKKQDDIKDSREFDYQYLLVISKYTILSKKQQQNEAQKRQKTTNDDNRLYYHFEDKVMWPEAVASFTYLTTFRYVDDAGNKHSTTGPQGGSNSETQYKVVYLIKFENFVKKIVALQRMLE